MSLWQKPEADSSNRSTHQPAPTAPTASAPEPRMSKPANIGQSVQIKGELTGNEDLTIDGTVDGKIVLRDHHLTIGPNGHICADVHAKTVQINGEVTGNITAGDKVEIAPSGTVEGDITAPRVALADGSNFKGSIDMSGNASKSSGSGAASVSPSVPMAAAGAKS